LSRSQLHALGLVTFRAYSTIRAVSAVCPLGGLGYYEVEILHSDAGMNLRLGFCSPEWSAETASGPEADGEGVSNGVGDDGLSWGIDGSLALKWHNKESISFGGLWREGDVVGLACDMRAGSGRILVSVNGDFAAPYGTAFDLPAIGLDKGLCPAVSARSGLLRCNLGGGRSFRHAPPSQEYCAMAAAGEKT
jgi:hypothetical protein